MSIVRQMDVVKYQSQVKLADLGADVSMSEITKGYSKNEDVETGNKIIRLLRALQKNEYLTNEEIENLLYCLIEVAGISEFPTPPVLLEVQRPSILNGVPGPQGPVGPQGPSGVTAVDIISDPTYDNISIIEETIAGIRTWKAGYAPYVAAITAMVISGTKTVEIGANKTINFTASYVKGREAISSQSIIAPAGFVWTTNPQGFADGVVLNARTTRAYTSQVFDGVTVDTKTQNVEFVFPIFHGGSASLLVTGTGVYTSLTKLIETIGNKAVVFSFVDKYAYFAFPDDYDDSAIVIKDQNGFPITDDFTRENFVVNSSGLAGGGGTDWSKGYTVYRTTNKTDIAGTYTIENVIEP